MIQGPVLLLNFVCVALLYCLYLLQLIVQKSLFRTMIAVLVILSFIACNNNRQSVNESKLPSTDSSVFYPVKEYFITQLAHTDSLPNIVYTYSDSEDKKDSLIISHGRLRQLAQSFLEDDINNIKIKKYYRESIFHDESTGSNTFNYTSVNTNLPLQTIDILLDTATDVVKSIFITKSFSKGDTLLTEKMWWKTNRGFSINSVIQPAGKPVITQRVTVSWNTND